MNYKNLNHYSTSQVHALFGFHPLVLGEILACVLPELERRRAARLAARPARKRPVIAHDGKPPLVLPLHKALLQQLYLSATKDAALQAYDHFIHRYEAKYPAACQCLAKDQEVLFAFYDFPAEHWRHIRTTNPIESTFATVRHRTRQTKGCGSRLATLTMAFKLTREAEKRWQRLHGYRLLDQVIAGAVFVDGELKNAA